MINSKNYNLILIPYLTVCCGLYHLTYWWLFGLDGLQLISIQNIIKSGISQVLNSILITFLGLLISTFIIKNENVKEPTNKYTLNAIFITFTTITFSIIGLIVYFFLEQVFLVTLGMLITIFIFYIIDRNKVFDTNFSPIISKKFLFLMMLNVFVFSIINAYEDANKILQNNSYKYLIRHIDTTNNNPTNVTCKDTLKLIGMTDQNLVFTNMKNDKIYFLKTDNIELSFKK